MRMTKTTAAKLAAASLVAGVALFGQGLAPADAGGGGCHSRPESEGTDAEVAIQGCFSPTVLRVAPNTRVTFRNTDSYVHVVIGQSWSATSELGAGAVSEVTFADQGSFPYACTLHPGMVGVIIVGDGVVRGTGGVPAVSAVYRETPAPTAAAAPAATVATPARGGDGMPGAAWLAIGVVTGAAVAGATGATVSRRRWRMRP